MRINMALEQIIRVVVDEILKNNELNRYTIGLFLDLSKAFDTLDHKIVLKKWKNTVLEE